MPEITINDAFGKAIYHTIRRYGFRSCLELGSFDGDGSTQVLIKALENAYRPRLVCLESNLERFQNLLKNTKNYSWVENQCCSTLSLHSLSIVDFDKDVWNTPFNKLKYPYGQVKNWWEQDIAYLKNVTSGYLESSSERFDAILIDGGEFSGYDEFHLVRNRTQCLMLDDVFHAFKNNKVHQELLMDKNWKLIFENPNVRNGASIFVRSHLRPLSWLQKWCQNFLPRIFHQ